MIICSDPHFGLTRKSGATPASMKAMSEYNASLLPVLPGEDLLITGDLFASFDVSAEALLMAWNWLQRWTGKVTILQGNHDLAKNRTQMSSLDFLGHVLPNVRIIREPLIEGDIAYVPHLANQELFDAAIAEAAKTATVLVTHTCFENPFAAEKDHSLSLARVQTDQYDLVLSGHEHVKTTRDNVFMLGSPYPCNIQEAQVDHFIHHWDGENEPQPVLCWESAPNYAEVDWKNLSAAPDVQYLRITGEAQAEQAATVIQEVTKLRANHSAFFITKSVKIGSLEVGVLDDIGEDLDTFDPVGLLKSLLKPEHRKRMEELTA